MRGRHYKTCQTFENGLVIAVSANIGLNGEIKVARVFAMSKRILVVEDEPASLKLLRYFSHEGYEIEGAKDGVEALKLFAQSRFDLVLSDVKMPRLDGVSLARHLLSNVPVTPIFLMTAYDFDNMDDILGLGVPCLSKPLSWTICCRKFRRCLDNSSKPNSELVD
jgi:CheY-like chemotaxis protein